MDIQKNSFLSIDQLANQVLEQNRTDPSPQVTDRGLTFGQVLAAKSLDQGGLKFSKHAAFRLSDRGIQMTQDQLTRLESGTRKAAEKGIRDSLVLVDDMAFIVNVPNQTVVTAMGSEDATENVFTNINGAVIM